MLLARALVHLAPTAALIDPSLCFTDLLRPLVPELRQMVARQATDLDRFWPEHRLDHPALALELPDLPAHLRDAVPGAPPSSAPAGITAAARPRWGHGRCSGAAVALGWCAH